MRKLLLLVAIIVIGCHQEKSKSVKKSSYHSRIFQSELDQYGYDIYHGSTLIIHQPIIPSIEGNKGFSDRTDAKKVADLIIFKLENNISPPAVDPKELDSLQVKLP